MSIVVWIAYAVIVTAAEGPVVIANDDYYPTQAACEAANADALAKLKLSPKYDHIMGVGMGCGSVDVEMHETKPVKPTQHDLEEQHPDPLHHSQWNSA